MSLLLDALKRAEHEKLARREDRPAGAAARGGPLELEPVRASAPTKAETAVAPAPPAQSTPARRRPWPLWLGAAALVLVVLTGSVYVWITISGLEGRSAIATPRAAPLRPVPVSQPGPTAPLAPDPVPSVATASVAPPRTAPLEPRAETLSAQSRSPAARAPAPAAPEPVERPAQPAQSEAEEPFSMSRAEKPAQVPADVAAGYDALLAGRIAEARARYAAALAADPANVDALLGFATVEARSGNRLAAAQHYRKVLDQEPRNATALAGLATLADLARPEALEAQLAADLAQDPASAALNFALGNLHAAQSRWIQAQAAYFEAHRLEPGNADILYNLAVSLDHLGEGRLAADFYARALEAARGQSAQFDRDAAARRVAELAAAR